MPVLRTSDDDSNRSSPFNVYTTPVGSARTRHKKLLEAPHIFRPRDLHPAQEALRTLTPTPQDLNPKPPRTLPQTRTSSTAKTHRRACETHAVTSDGHVALRHDGEENLLHEAEDLIPDKFMIGV